MELRKKFNGKIGSLVYINFLGEVGRVTSNQIDGNVLGKTVCVSYPNRTGGIVDIKDCPVMFLRMSSKSDVHKYRQRMKKSISRWDMKGNKFILKDSVQRIEYSSKMYYYVSEFGEINQSKVKDFDPVADARKSSGNYFEDIFSARKFLENGVWNDRLIV